MFDGQERELCWQGNLPKEDKHQSVPVQYININQINGLTPFCYIDIMKEMLYEVRCLKSNEDMILALAGQF